MLQAHYRSTLDFSNDALKAAEKGLKKLLTTNTVLQSITATGNVFEAEETSVNKFLVAIYAAMNNDFNSPQAIAEMYEIATLINTWGDKGKKQANIHPHTLSRLQKTFSDFLFTIFGLKDESAEHTSSVLDAVMDLVIDIRKDVRAKKDFATSDKIRDGLKHAGIQLFDGKDETSWGLL
jgi:cysteinyl-tRNA synthetase